MQRQTCDMNLCVENLVSAVEVISNRWEELRANLCVPVLEELHDSQTDRLSAVFRHMLKVNPYASWRSVVQELDRMKEHKVANRIRSFIKPVSDSTLTVERSISIIQYTQQPWDKIAGLADLLRIPFSIQTGVKRAHSAPHSQKAEIMKYWLNTSPTASWESLADVLYKLRETDALRELMVNFLKDLRKDSSLCLDNLLEVSSSLSDSDLSILWVSLAQPPLDSSLSSEEKRVRLFAGYLKSHPAPSWRGVAWALYTVGGGTAFAHKAVEPIYQMLRESLGASNVGTTPNKQPQSPTIPQDMAVSRQQIDYPFVEEVPDELVCQICCDVMDHPCLMSCCGENTNSCQNCIGILSRKRTCPWCKTQGFSYQLRIFCPHQRQGCKWAGGETELEAHLLECFFEDMPCPKKCGTTVIRKVIKEHLEQCSHRRVRCQYCGLKDMYKIIAGSHFSVCPNLPLASLFELTTVTVLD